MRARHDACHIHGGCLECLMRSHVDGAPPSSILLLQSCARQRLTFKEEDFMYADPAPFIRPGTRGILTRCFVCFLRRCNHFCDIRHGTHEALKVHLQGEDGVASVPGSRSTLIDGKTIEAEKFNREGTWRVCAIEIGRSRPSILVTTKVCVPGRSCETTSQQTQHSMLKQ